MFYLVTLQFQVILFHFVHFGAQLQNYMCCIISFFLDIQEIGVEKFDNGGNWTDTNL